MGEEGLPIFFDSDTPELVLPPLEKKESKGSKLSKKAKKAASFLMSKLFGAKEGEVESVHPWEQHGILDFLGMPRPEKREDLSLLERAAQFFGAKTETSKPFDPFEGAFEWSTYAPLESRIDEPAGDLFVHEHAAVQEQSAGSILRRAWHKTVSEVSAIVDSLSTRLESAAAEDEIAQDEEPIDNNVDTERAQSHVETVYSQKFPLVRTLGVVGAALGLASRGERSTRTKKQAANSSTNNTPTVETMQPVAYSPVAVDAPRLVAREIVALAESEELQREVDTPEASRVHRVASVATHPEVFTAQPTAKREPIATEPALPKRESETVTKPKRAATFVLPEKGKPEETALPAPVRLEQQKPPTPIESKKNSNDTYRDKKTAAEKRKADTVVASEINQDRAKEKKPAVRVTPEKAKVEVTPSKAHSEQLERKAPKTPESEAKDATKRTVTGAIVEAQERVQDYLGEKAESYKNVQRALVRGVRTQARRERVRAWRSKWQPRLVRAAAGSSIAFSAWWLLL